ncbi:hypothetical protein CL673_06465 [Candidatus Bathyarchaeota archaeon]|nr:hypothetical protein [Candidatus Bathyarchaeota archaeon]MDP6048945.1 zinc-ribbon domain-containing protein [Candidatus Bathyarchaeota archaeon]MDP7443851.1 zinc-ribbon domain-containing protein [Candidatus Bathyarchaeota archaeon]
MTLGNGRKIWWRCSRGHEWEAAVASRIRGTGCPDCFFCLDSLWNRDLMHDHPILYSFVFLKIFAIILLI